MDQSTTQIVAETLNLIAISEHTELEYIQILIDSLVLATEQVQDIRLSILEAGPEVSANEIFIAVLTTFLLESNIAGRAVALLARKTMLPRLQKFRNVFQLEQPRTPADTTLYLKAVADPNITLIREQATTEIKIGKLLYGLVTSEYAPEYAGAALKAARDGYNKMNVNRIGEARIRGDSPGVALLTAVQEYSSTMRFLIKTMHSGYPAEVITNPDSAPKIKAALGVRFGQCSLDEALAIMELRRKLKITFEGAIWAGLLQFGTAKAPRLEDSAPLPKLTFQMSLENIRRSFKLYFPSNSVWTAIFPDIVPSALVKYLTDRLIDPSDKDSRTFSEANRDYNDDRRTMSDADLNYGAVKKLVDYLNKVGQAIDENTFLLSAVNKVGEVKRQSQP